MKKPHLTPDNVMNSENQVDCRSWESDKCLRLHMEINDYIEFLCDNNSFDGGGRYASWLNNLGFQHQTDNGWWNETAVDLDNINLFAEWYKWDGDLRNEKLESIRSRIDLIKNAKAMKVGVQLIAEYSKISDFLNVGE